MMLHGFLIFGEINSFVNTSGFLYYNYKDDEQPLTYDLLYTPKPALPLSDDKGERWDCNFVFNQFDTAVYASNNSFKALYDADSTEAVRNIQYFTPRLAIRINPQTGSTDILSNFKLILRPQLEFEEHVNAYLTTDPEPNPTADTFVAFKMKVPKDPNESLEKLLGFAWEDNPGIKDFYGDRNHAPHLRSSHLITNANYTASDDDPKPLHSCAAHDPIEFNGQLYFYTLSSEFPGLFTDNDYVYLTCPTINTRSKFTEQKMGSRKLG